MIGVASRPLALLFRLYLGHPTDTRIYTFALVGGVKRLLALVLLLFRFNTQTSQPNTLLTLTYTLTQTRINQYCSLTSSPHVCKTVPARETSGGSFCTHSCRVDPKSMFVSSDAPLVAEDDVGSTDTFTVSLFASGQPIGVKVKDGQLQEQRVQSDRGAAKGGGGGGRLGGGSVSRCASPLACDVVKPPYVAGPQAVCTQIAPPDLLV